MTQTNLAPAGARTTAFAVRNRKALVSRTCEEQPDGRLSLKLARSRTLTTTGMPPRRNVIDVGYDQVAINSVMT